ncbi:MAG: PIG-L family deacetylase [Verrucomicrobiia bacterium]
MNTRIKFNRSASGHIHWLLNFLAATVCTLTVFLIDIRAAEPQSASAILQELRGFREMGSVLYIAAHPDDENTRLIAYLSRGRGYRTGYLSLTRGDGGQNLIGPELGEELGVVRTQELLAARRIDGGQQFFTRAIDFGFSKDYRETFRIWDRNQVLADVVRTIRGFRPDVLITRFSTVPGGTHGHHTASAILAVEAFKLAGDTNAFPEQLGELKPWQPKRILWNGFPRGFGRGGGDETNAPGLQIDIGGYNPVLGESYGEIAARSRSMHKTQGFGSVGTRGTINETFQLLGGEPATKDILDGVDTTWGRVAGGAEIGRLADEAIARFNPQNPAASVPALLTLRNRLAALPTDSVIAEKRRQLDHILRGCLGLYVETVIPLAEAVPGETLKMRHAAIVRADFPVRWTAVRYPAGGEELGINADLKSNQGVTHESSRILPATTPLTQPYWLREEGTIGMFRVDDPSLIGRPENPPAFPVEFMFEVGGQTLVIPDEPVQVIGDRVKGEIRQRLEVTPPVSLNFPEDLELFAPGTSRPVVVEVTSAHAGATGTLHLETPTGWKATPATYPFSLTNYNETARFTFTITAPTNTTAAKILATAEIDGKSYHNRRVEIRHDHIPPILLQPSARLKALSVDLAIRGHQIGYLPGAGDSVAECLQRMGYAVTVLTDADLTPDHLRSFDAVVIGIRAFNTRTDLAQNLSGLFAYVEAGGNVIVQYNTSDGLQTTRLAPYDLKISHDRVTDATAPMTLLVPDHPAFTTPNRIVPSDFDGWIQERGLYFASEWDGHFTPLLACNDPGESPKSGSLLVARYGRGYFVYTGLSWFRQLPEGVPGAYRLFANLISLGK